MTGHFVLTLSGAVQRLSSLLAGAECRAMRVLSLQPNSGNGNPVYVGASSSLSDSNYGFRLEAADTGVPPAPYILGEFDDGALYLHDFYVLGTNGEKLHIFVAFYG